MGKSFADRLAALEALEAEQEASTGRRLELWVQMRPVDYFTLFEVEPHDTDTCARLHAAYGFDLIDWDADRVHVMGGTWTGVRKALDSTIARAADADGYGYWIDTAPWVDCPQGEPAWHIATSEKVEALRRAHRQHLLANSIRALEAGELVVRPFNPAQDLRTHEEGQIATCIESTDPALAYLRGVVANTLDWAQLRTGGPFVQSSAEALAVLRDMPLQHLWLSQTAVWPQRHALMTKHKENHL